MKRNHEMVDKLSLMTALFVDDMEYPTNLHRRVENRRDFILKSHSFSLIRVILNNGNREMKEKQQHFPHQTIQNRQTHSRPIFRLFSDYLHCWKKSLQVRVTEVHVDGDELCTWVILQGEKLGSFFAREKYLQFFRIVIRINSRFWTVRIVLFGTPKSSLATSIIIRDFRSRYQQKGSTQSARILPRQRTYMYIDTDDILFKNNICCGYSTLSK